MSCKEISADWAAQRIKGLSLWTAVLERPVQAEDARRRPNGKVIKTLIDTFRYPRKGPGMMWEACAEQDQGAWAARSQMGTQGRRPATTTTRRELWTVTAQDARRQRADDRSRARHLLGADAAARQRPHADDARQHVLDGRQGAAVSRLPHGRPDPQGPRRLRRQLDLHPRSEREGRPRPELQVVVAGDGAGSVDACYGLEYFCFEGDGLWTATDADLIELAKAELEKIGLAKPEDVIDGCVVRQPKAYPVYDDDYAKHVETDPRGAARQLPDPAPGRPQRHAQVQQPGPRHDDRHAVREEHRRRRTRLRPVAGQPGRRVPRGRRSRCAARRRCARAWCRNVSEQREWMAMRITVSLPAGRRHMRPEHSDTLRAWLPPRFAPIVEPVLGLVPQLSRYTLVSALALVLDFTVYLLLAAGGMAGALAGAIGYACGLALHYMLSVRYVFDAAGRSQGPVPSGCRVCTQRIGRHGDHRTRHRRHRRPRRHAAAASQNPGGRRELPGGLRPAAPRRIRGT